MAVKLVNSFKKEFEPRYFYEIEVRADDDRIDGCDYIKITILDSNGEFPEKEILLDMIIPEDPELVYKTLHEG